MTAIAQTQSRDTDHAASTPIATGQSDKDRPLTIRTTGEGGRWVTRITRGNWIVYVTPTAQSETDARRLAQLFLDELKRR